MEKTEKNQSGSRQPRSVFIALLRTHNPSVPGSNPGGPTSYLRRFSFSSSEQIAAHSAYEGHAKKSRASVN